MITMSHLFKQFGWYEALHDVTLDFERGVSTGIIGPNGSGKSTLIKCILGLVKPTSGTITVGGHILNGGGDYRRLIGYVPQIARFPQDLTGREILKLTRGLRRDPAVRQDELIERFGLSLELDKRVRTLSGGTRQKLSIVVAGMFDPDLLILDEPTAGLDPVSNVRLKDYLLHLKTQGKTVLITTHIMSDLEDLADSVVVLLDGRVRFFGAVRDLKFNMGEPRLELAVARLLERGAA